MMRPLLAARSLRNVNGVALLLAVGLSKYQRTARRSAAVAGLLRRRRMSTPI